MANAIYDAFINGILSNNPDFDLDADTIKVTLIDTANYTFSAAHQYMNTNTVPAAAKVGTPQTLAGKAVAARAFDANDVTFSSVTGATVEAIIVWKDGGGGGTSVSGTTDPLIAYIDTAGGTLPVTPNGGDIQIQWAGGPNFIFKF